LDRVVGRADPATLGGGCRAFVVTVRRIQLPARPALSSRAKKLSKEASIVGWPTNGGAISIVSARR
jgi:hypothetical protein